MQMTDCSVLISFSLKFNFDYGLLLTWGHAEMLMLKDSSSEYTQGLPHLRERMDVIQT